MEWKAHTDRIISARFRTRVRNVTVVQCYAPTEVSEVEQKEEFYNNLTKVFQEIRRGDIVILLGDFNAQLGDNNAGLENTMGRHGIGSMTEKGELFSRFCLNHNLVIGGTLFPHKRIHKVTWVSPDRLTENQIDHFAISKKWRGSLLDVRNKRGADISSDHHLLIANIRLKVAAIKKGDRYCQKKFDTIKLEDPNIRSRFTNAIRNSFHDGQISDRWAHTKNTLLKAAEEHIGYKTTPNKPWISENTWTLIKLRAEAKNEENSAKTRSAKTLAQKEYSRLDRLVKKSARSDKRQWSEQIATKAQAAAETHRSRDLFRSVRQLTTTTFSASKPLTNPSGETTTSKEEQIKIWEDYYKNLLTAPSQPSSTICTCLAHQESPQFETSCPGIPEIVLAIASLKSNKSPGPDNIPPELLKADHLLSAELLHPLISDFWTNESLPAQLKEGTVTLLPKKGNLSLCKNWRGITLLSMVNKVIAHIINKRISDFVSLRNEQAGFRARRSCVDHVNTLRIIVEQSVEWRSPLYICFIDFAKAFDTIRHDVILKTLECKGVPQKIIRLVESLYQGATCRIRHEQQLSGHIRVEKGVRQGCVLSPLLFNIVLDAVMTRVSQNNSGITWGLQGKLGDLDYADDICLLAHKLTDVKKMLSDVKKYAELAGLSMNIPKTKLMRINASSTEDITIENNLIDSVDSFCYLGSIITAKGGTAEDIRFRINKGRAAFSSLEKIWRSTYISRNTKIKIFNASIKSALLYGCETWKAANKELQALQAFVNRCLRKIMRIFWPNTITNEALWTATEQKPIVLEIRRRKWMWIGHTLRKPHDDIARSALDWNPQGSRRRGRPANTWRRLVEEEAAEAGYTWREVKRLAADRSKWNEFVMALCSS